MQGGKRQTLFYWLAQYSFIASLKSWIQIHEKNKTVYFFSTTATAAELNVKTSAEPKTINLHSNGFSFRFHYDSFSNKSTVTLSHDINKNGKIRPGYDTGTQREWNFSWVYIHCIFVYGIYGMIYSVACLHRYHSKLVSEWFESTLISSSSSEIEIWRHDMCKLWTKSVLSFEQI